MNIRAAAPNINPIMISLISRKIMSEKLVGSGGISDATVGETANVASKAAVSLNRADTAASPQPGASINTEPMRANNSAPIQTYGRRAFIYMLAIMAKVSCAYLPIMAPISGRKIRSAIKIATIFGTKTRVIS